MVGIPLWVEDAPVALCELGMCGMRERWDPLGPAWPGVTSPGALSDRVGTNRAMTMVGGGRAKGTKELDKGCRSEAPAGHGRCRSKMWTSELREKWGHTMAPC